MSKDNRQAKKYANETQAKKIINLHNKGVNAYDIAGEIFDFTSEEAVERVKNTIAKAEESGNLIKKSKQGEGK